MNPTTDMYVKPVEGRQVRDPLTRQVVPPEGRAVPRESYWVRRVNDGDLVEASAPATLKPTRLKDKE